MDVGIDESLYSPHLAGSCVVAACWLPEEHPFQKGSNHVPRKRRFELLNWLKHHAVYAVELATPADIGRFGVFEARNLAARSAIRGLEERLRRLGLGEVKRVWVDTNLWHGLRDWVPEPRLLRVRDADDRVPCVSAASVVARCYVDLLLSGWRAEFPEYDFGMNVTSAHREALRELGPIAAHREGVYAPRWWERLLEDPSPVVRGT